MPKSINTEHIERMFPFEFYDELSPQIPGYTIMNAAFFNHDAVHINESEKRQKFAKHRKEAEKLNQMNILSIEPVGELLILDTCFAKEHTDAMLKGGVQRSQVPMSILTVQLYDSTNQPVFASDVSEETIARIPEVLWDDPNLLIAIVTLSEEGPKLSIFKAPPQIERHLEQMVFESKESAESRNHEE